MPQAIKKNAEERMEKAIGALKRDLATLACRSRYSSDAGSCSS